MRKLYLTLLSLFWIVGLVPAQVVTFEPAFPNEEAPITIFFHAAEGTGGLAGYTGDVYAHTGVITERSQDPGDWRYVKTPWPSNRDDIRLERVGPDLYKLEIQDIRAYYSDNETGAGPIPASEEILKLAFVFRNADGTREGKGPGGTDLFIDLFPTGVNVRFAAPAADPLTPLIAERDTTLAIVAVGSAADTTLAGLRLLVDGVEVAQTAADTLTYSLLLDQPGRMDVQAIAEDAGGAADTASFYAVRNALTPDAPRPAGVEDGINYAEGDPSTVTLSLYAPGKRYVYVLGDFNGWQVDPAYLMRRDEAGADSVYWWLTVDGLTPGQEYGFQYFVDGEIRVADPYAEKVLDPFHDEAIPATTYPDLKPYPAGLTEHIVSVLQTGQAAYPWTVEAFGRPAPEALVIYELLVRDFVAAHDYATLVDTLDYLVRLGVNAVELMPVAEFDGNLSWGYNPAFAFAPDKYYGPADDLKRFVDAAHQRGLAVVLDVVYNHLTGQAPFVRLYNDGDFGAPTADNPWVNQTARHPFNVFYDVNHESGPTQYWLDRANAYWLTEYQVDGFRYDLSKGFTQKNTGSDVGAWSAYDASRIRLIERMADRIWDVDPGAYIILEHFAANSEEQELARYRTDEGLPGMVLWQNMNRPYSQSAMGYLNDGNFSSDLSNVYYERRGFAAPRLVTYMESHDEQWLMYRNLMYGPEEDGYDVKTLAVSLDRMKLAAAFFLTVPGPKMIWEFGELGYGYGPDGTDCLRGGEGLGECPPGTPDRVDPKPIRWEYRSDPLREKLYKTYAALLKLRNEHEVFRSPETEVALRVGQGQADRRIGLSHPTMDAVIVGNFGTAGRDVVPAFQMPGTWYDYFTGDSLVVSDVNAPIALLPGAFHLYTSRPVGPPEPGLITVAEEGGTELPEAVALGQNYPNPFNPVTTIRYALPAAGRVQLDVFDVLGRRVALLVDGVRPAGEHEVVFDARSLPSGTYLYRLQSGSRSLARTMLVLK